MELSELLYNKSEYIETVRARGGRPRGGGLLRCSREVSSLWRGRCYERP